MKREDKRTKEIADEIYHKRWETILMEGKRGGFKKMKAGLSHPNA